MKRILAPILGTAFLLCLGLQSTEAAVITCSYGQDVTTLGPCNTSDALANGGEEGRLGGTQAIFYFDPDETNTVDYFVALTFDTVLDGSFEVEMEDFPEPLGFSAGAGFEGWTCLPIYPLNQLNPCVRFHIDPGAEVDPSVDPPGWQGGYTIEVFWNANTDQPGDFTLVRLLHKPEGGEFEDITVPGSYCVGEGCAPPCGANCSPPQPPIECCFDFSFPKTDGDPGITGVDDSFSDEIVMRAPIPEPSSILLLATGGAGLLLRRWRRRR